MSRALAHTAIGVIAGAAFIAAILHGVVTESEVHLLPIPHEMGNTQ